MWEGQIQMISDSARSFDGVKSEIFVPKYANHVPSLKIHWDSKKINITPNQFRHELRSGHPSIETTGDNESVGITTWMMEPGQRELFQEEFVKYLIWQKTGIMDLKIRIVIGWDT